MEAYLSDVLGRDVLITRTWRGPGQPQAGAADTRRPGRDPGFREDQCQPPTRDLIRAERAALDILAAADLRALTSAWSCTTGSGKAGVLVMMRTSGVASASPTAPWALAGAMSELSAVGGQRRDPLAACEDVAGLRSGGRPPGRRRPGPRSRRPDRAGRDLDPAELRRLARRLDELELPARPRAAGLGLGTFRHPCRPASTLLHHRLQSAVVPGAAATCRAADCMRTRPARSLCGSPAHEAPLVGLLYVAELATRYIS